MKKILLAISFFLLMPIYIHASSNEISNIDVNIYLDEVGNASITETWKVKGYDGTEWYKVLNNLGNSELTDYTVSMDGIPLVSKPWDINESLETKKGYYGINYTSDGLELCFGKYDYLPHTFVLNYKLSNYVFNTEDAQVLYWNIIDRLSDVDFQNFSVTVRSYYEFPDTLDVWGYGYKGYAYVNSGIIGMSNEEETNMNDQYVVLLAKFPLNTFKTENSYSEFNTFDEISKMAEEGAKSNKPNQILQFIINAFQIIITLGIPFLCIIFAVKSAYKNSYGYKDNKKITKNDTHMFREIPCNKDIHYANTLMYLNKGNMLFPYKETNILGAVILKWVKEDKIKFIKDTTGIFNKETYSIDLTRENTFTNSFESNLFSIMKEASKDGILEQKEFEKWAKRNYKRFFAVFNNKIESDISVLKNNLNIRKRTDKKECKMGWVMSDNIYKDSSELLGLKLYLEEFSAIDTKEVMDVKLWDEYLMFAYLFGIADEVSKQFKKLYPEYIQNLDYDVDTIVIINHMSSGVSRAASSARSAAQSYSSGGGGFSSSGGGGGSFGGGGGGSR